MKDIENNILTGYYKTVDSFDADFTRLFNNVQVRLIIFGPSSETGCLATTVLAIENIKRADGVLIQDFSVVNQTASLIAQKYCGSQSEIGKVVNQLRKVYQDAKTEAAEQLDIILNDTWSSRSTASEGYSTDNNDG